jgi:hypothetical protein
LLADHRTDPITKVLLKVGDEVVACAGCKAVFLADVWRGMDQKCCQCGGTATTSEIPNNENITFSKPGSRPLNGTAPVKKVSYAGTAILFGLIAAASAIYALNTNNSVTQKEDENSSLNSRIGTLSNEYNTLQEKVADLQKEKNRLSSGYNALLDLVNGISMVCGVRLEEAANYNFNYGTGAEKIYFTVKQPLLLKSVKVRAKVFHSGFLRLKILNAFGVTMGEASGDVDDGPSTMRFNTHLSPGKYHIVIQEGNVDLLYLNNYSGYPIRSNDLIEISGTEIYNSLYLYYFDWEYALQLKAKNN